MTTILQYYNDNRTDSAEQICGICQKRIEPSVEHHHTYTCTKCGGEAYFGNWLLHANCQQSFYEKRVKQLEKEK